MKYFTKEYLEFFKELAANNNKIWFDANRKRYEDNVRKPMISLVQDVIKAMQKHDLEFDPNPKKCLSRINRDIRFSKDKTPYNTHFFAHITKGTKEDPKPGIAFRFGVDFSGIMTGFYKPTKDQLANIRENISSDLPQFKKLYSDKKLKNSFGDIKGEAYKRIPPDLQADFEQEPLIANKQFYFVVEKEAKFVLSDRLKETIIDHWLAVKPLNDFLSR